jgi:hypothetical protein
MNKFNNDTGNELVRRWLQCALVSSLTLDGRSRANDQIHAVAAAVHSAAEAVHMRMMGQSTVEPVAENQQCF